MWEDVLSDSRLCELVLLALLVVPAVLTLELGLVLRVEAVDTLDLYDGGGEEGIFLWLWRVFGQLPWVGVEDILGTFVWKGIVEICLF